MMGKEKILQDENVAEYLKLIANADKQQAQRIKTVFDKKNVKSQANIDRVRFSLTSAFSFCKSTYDFL